MEKESRTLTFAVPFRADLKEIPAYADMISQGWIAKLARFRLTDADSANEITVTFERTIEAPPEA